MTGRRTRWLLAAGAVAAAMLLAGAGGWRAARPAHPPSLHDRAVAVEQGLRCPTCQGLSVADSPSPIAAGMRQQVQHQLAGGASPAQVRGYFTARYGDWILLDPPRRGLSWLLWAAPALLLAAGLLLIRRRLRRRDAAAATPAELTAAAEFAAAAARDLATLPEPVAAALADVRASRLEADLDPAEGTDLVDPLTRLATALHDHPLVAAAPNIDDPEHTGSEPSPAPTQPRGRHVRYAVPVAAVLFAGLLGATLARSIGNRPAGDVPTGAFATAPAATDPAASTPAADLAALSHATTQRPSDPAAWLAYATALDQSGQLAAAEPNYRNALALDPGNVAAREQLSWLLTRGGSPSEALAVLNPLTRQRPNDPQVVLLLGLAQRGAGQPQADTTLRRYLQLDPDTAQAAVVRELLKAAP